MIQRSQRQARGRRTLRLIASTWFLALVLGASVSAETVRLKSGGFLVGKIKSADESGLVIERFDNHGILRLRWSDVTPPDQERLKKLYNLVDDVDQSPVTIRAFQCQVERAGAIPQTLVGELVGRDGKSITIYKLGNRFTIPLSKLRGTAQFVEVPIRDILKPQEIYRRKLTEIDPGENADLHIKLAAYLQRVDDLERAYEHLSKAKELGTTTQASKLEGMIQRLDRLRKHKAEADLLRGIDIARNRNDFHRALALIEDFASKFPDSQLKAEFEAAKIRVEKSRGLFYVRRITRDWYSALREEAKTLARQRTLSIEEARVRAEEALGKSIRERIAKMRKIKAEEVEAFFRARLQSPSVPKIQLASYGQGSWLLGEKDLIEKTARAKLKAKGKAAKKDSQGDRIRRELERRLREFIKSQGGKSKQKGEQKLATEAEWWKRAKSTERSLWLMAYYAEKAGDMEIVSAMLRDCPTCGAKGVVAIQGLQGGKTAYPTCPTCHGLKFFRSVRFH